MDYKEQKNTVVFERIKHSFDQQNFLALIGVELESVQRGEVITSCTCREDLTQQQGFLHGGVVTTLADITCGYTALSVMPDNMEVLTVEFKINILRPVISGKIAAKGKVVKAGKRLVITESTVYDSSSGKEVARMLATMIPQEKSTV